jgi:hypothetical protein
LQKLTEPFCDWKWLKALTLPGITGWQFGGCGAPCAMFAAVNLKTGRLITAREFATVLGTHLAIDDDFMPGTRSDAWGFRYKEDSLLLVVVGVPGEDESRAGAYYFVLQGERLRLIHTTRVNKHCEAEKP